MLSKESTLFLKNCWNVGVNIKSQPNPTEKKAGSDENPTLLHIYIYLLSHPTEWFHRPT